MKKEKINQIQKINYLLEYLTSLLQKINFLVVTQTQDQYTKISCHPISHL